MCKRDAPTWVRIRLWPLKRDDNSRVLIGVAGMWHSDWPARVYSNDVSTRIDNSRAGACGSLQ